MQTTIRFFVVDYDTEEDACLLEVTENDFLAAPGAITYERHTIFQNGADQVILIKGLDNA